MIDSLAWNDESNMLAALADGKLMIWYYPNAAYVDKSLLPKTVFERNARSAGLLLLGFALLYLFHSCLTWLLVEEFCGNVLLRPTKTFGITSNECYNQRSRCILQMFETVCCDRICCLCGFPPLFSHCLVARLLFSAGFF